MPQDGKVVIQAKLLKDKPDLDQMLTQEDPEYEDEIGPTGHMIATGSDEAEKDAAVLAQEIGDYAPDYDEPQLPLHLADSLEKNAKEE